MMASTEPGREVSSTATLHPGGAAGAGRWRWDLLGLGMKQFGIHELVNLSLGLSK